MKKRSMDVEAEVMANPELRARFSELKTKGLFETNKPDRAID